MSTIHINPKNKGKFNATKRTTGKSTEELTHSKNALTRKRAIFAQNVKKWEHDLGGYLEDPIQNNKNISIPDKRVFDMVTGKRMTDRNRMSTNVDSDYLKELIKYSKKYDIDPYTTLSIGLQETRLGNAHEQYKKNPLHVNYDPFEETLKNNQESTKRDLINYYQGYLGDEGKVSDVSYYGNITMKNRSGFDSKAFPELKDNKYLKAYKESRDARNKYYEEGTGRIESSVKFLKDKLDYAKRLGKTGDTNIIQAWNGYGNVSNDKEMYGIDTSKQPINMSKNPVYGKRVVNLRDSVLKSNPEIVKLVNDTMKEYEFGGSLDPVSAGFSLGNAIINPLVSNSENNEQEIYNQALLNSNEVNVDQMGLKGFGQALGKNWMYGPVGLVSGIFGANQAKKQARDFNTNLAQQKLNMNVKQRLSTLSNSPSYMPVAKQGGFTIYKGETHEGPNGGILTDEQGNPSGLSNNNPIALTEKNEVARYDPESRSTYIYSDSLGFAKPAINLVHKYKLNKSTWNNLYKNDPLLKVAVDKQFDNLQTAQEFSKETKTSSTDSINIFKNGGTLTANKAKEMLKDGTAHKKPLTSKQKRYFGYIAGGGKPQKELGGDLPKYDGNDKSFIYPRPNLDGADFTKPFRWWLDPLKNLPEVGKTLWWSDPKYNRNVNFVGDTTKVNPTAGNFTRGLARTLWGKDTPGTDSNTPYLDFSSKFNDNDPMQSTDLSYERSLRTNKPVNNKVISNPNSTNPMPTVDLVRPEPIKGPITSNNISNTKSSKNNSSNNRPYNPIEERGFEYFDPNYIPPNVHPNNKLISKDNVGIDNNSTDNTSTDNNYTPWLNPLGQIASGVGSLADYFAMKKARPNQLHLPRVGSERVSFANQRLINTRNAENSRITNTTMARGMGMNAGATFANTAAANTGVNRLLGQQNLESLQNQENINAQMQQQADTINAQIGMQEGLYNSEMNNAYDTMMAKLNPVGNLARTAGSYFIDNAAYQQGYDTMKMLAPNADIYQRPGKNWTRIFKKPGVRFK